MCTVTRVNLEIGQPTHPGKGLILHRENDGACLLIDSSQFLLTVYAIFSQL